MSEKISRTHVLYSPGYGAGWSSWNTSLPREAQELILRHTSVVGAVLAGEDLTEDHHAIVEMVSDVREVTGDPEEYVCILGGVGRNSPRAYETSKRVRIDEYDGFESVVEEGEDEWL